MNVMHREISVIVDCCPFVSMMKYVKIARSPRLIMNKFSNALFGHNLYVFVLITLTERIKKAVQPTDRTVIAGVTNAEIRK